jgi:hypothetical protein
MKQITALKFACVGAFVATLGVGCASSGYARADADSTDMDRGMGVSAGADVGSASASVDADTSIRTDSNQIRTEVDSPSVRTDVDVDSPTIRTDVDTDIDTDRDITIVDRDVNTMTTTDTEGEDRITVSALAMNPETRATWVNRFPFYDSGRQLRTIDVITFAVPDPDADIELSTRASDAPDFRSDLPSGSVFVEAAGGAGEVSTGRVIQHSPNPTR